MITHSRYKNKEDAYPLIALLEKNLISYQIENISSSIDALFVGGTDLEDKIAIKIHASDSEKVELLNLQVAKNEVNFIDKSHYLFEFSNNELIEVIDSFDEWSKVDVALAQKILIDRNINMSDDLVEQMRNQKLSKLRQGEAGDKLWIAFGFFTAILGGFLSLILGNIYFKSKKTLPNGEQVYTYDEKTRNSGRLMSNIGLIVLAFWTCVFLLTFFAS